MPGMRPTTVFLQYRTGVVAYISWESKVHLL